MKESNIKGSIDSVETLGLVDGPGIRTVVFLNGCNLRCKYCHNPEMWQLKEENITKEELINKILRMKPYYKENGGVTFSGGEPLLQSKFLLEVAKELKKENIHIAIDTAGYASDYEELLEYVDLIILDIKHINEKGYQDITSKSINKVEQFINTINKKDKKVWIRQVIIPDVNDNEEYLECLSEYLKKIKNIEKIEFLPYHTMGNKKYEKLNIPNFYKDKKAMDKEKCEELYQKFIKKYYKTV